MMRSKVFIVFFTILLIFGQIVFGQEKGVGNRKVSKLPAKEKRWALIISVSQYEDGNITLLPGANNDAKALRDALRDYAGFDEKQIILLTTDESKDRQPTKNNILRYLGNLSGTVPKDGLLLVAFSGHGIERQNQAFLLASDTPYNDNVRVLERTAISVSNDFKELVRDTGVGQVIILLDACRNDPSNGRSSSDNPLTQAYTNGFNFDVRNKKVEAFATLYATSIGERAYEYTRESKGYFTWSFIEGLKGGAANASGKVTLGNLIPYVEKYVPQQVKIDLGGNKLQRPFSIVEGYKAEELVLGLGKHKILTSDNNSISTTNTSNFEDEVSFNYEVNKTFVIGSGDYEFITSWSNCSSFCIWASSDYLDGVANTRKIYLEKILDATSYDMSSRTRQINTNEIIVLKNKKGYYALIQVKQIFDDKKILTINYKIIPNKFQSTWSYNPNLYLSKSKSGKIKYNYDNNNGDFTIGEKDFAFNLTWSSRSSTGQLVNQMYFYRTSGISAFALVPDNLIVTNAEESAKISISNERSIILDTGKQVVLKNSNNYFALIKFVSATKRSGEIGEDEVIFEYEIFSK